jgi:hypothetical protein
MAKNFEQIPAAARGAAFAVVNVEKAATPNRSPYRKYLASSILGLVLTAILAPIWGDVIGWVLLGAFVILTAVSAFAAVLAARNSAPVEPFSYFEVREGGVLVPSNFFITWDEIASGTYEWSGPNANTLIGQDPADSIAPFTVDSRLGTVPLEMRVITFALNDYSSTKSRSGGQHTGALVGPLFGSPGTASVALADAVDDAAFRALLEVIHRELSRRGTPFRVQSDESMRVDREAYAVRKAAAKG